MVLRRAILFSSFDIFLNVRIGFNFRLAQLMAFAAMLGDNARMVNNLYRGNSTGAGETKNDLGQADPHRSLLGGVLLHAGTGLLGCSLQQSQYLARYVADIANVSGVME